MADKPELSCEAEWSGRLGQRDYEILCTAHMNPEPLQVVWQWHVPLHGDVEILNDVVSHQHLAEVVPVSLMFSQLTDTHTHTRLTALCPGLPG